MPKFIKNRIGDVVEFDLDRIRIAIIKAYEAAGVSDISNIEDLLLSIEAKLKHKQSHLQDEEFVTVDTIQDIVEKELMEFGQFTVAKKYILYRNKHDEMRKQQHEEELSKLDHHELHVTKSNGSVQFFSWEKIAYTYQRIAGEFAQICPFVDLQNELKKYLTEKIKTSDINHLLVKSAVNLISIENISWQEIAGRFATIDLYKKASKERKLAIEELYSPTAFADLVKEYVERDLYYQSFFDAYSYEDFVAMGQKIVAERDMEYGYTTLLMFKKRYLLNPNGVIKELPQHMYMAIAMFLAIPEKPEERLAVASKFYDIISQQKLSLATPTLMNARRKFHQLSSCFVLNVDDDLRSIYHNIENIAQISKFGGGVGSYLGHVRSKGSSIRGVKGVSGGIVPRVKVINDTAVAVNQLGARAGAVSLTTDVWHRDILDFLDLQTETGDMRRKAFDIFPAISIPDLFMQRVESNGSWTLFDPKEVADVTGQRLEDQFGDVFSSFYEACEADDRLELKKTIPARDLFKTYLKCVVETGMPYVFFRDTANRYNPNKHAGNVYSSQLCTEIIQNTTPAKFLEETEEDGTIAIKYQPGESVVCNLASINMAKVTTDEDMQEVIPLSMRLLDNVIELNFFPFKESELTAKKYRSVGLGFLGLAEHLAVNKMSYESLDARKYVDRLFEKYAYHVIKASNQLAQERGSYELFPGSDWSKGILFGKDKSRFRHHSDMSEEWCDLIDDVQQDGVRFSYHTSPAPNTSTANVVGTTAGLLPIYKKYFVYTDAVAPSVNVAPKLSPENLWYYKEYVHMKMPEVIDMIAVIQKWIDQSISFEWIINPADTSPKDLYDYYLKAWKQELKTVYYVRSMTLDVKECVGCSG